MSGVPTGKLRRTYSGPPLHAFQKNNGRIPGKRVGSEDSVPTIASSSSSAAPSITAERLHIPTSVLSRRLTRHASIDTNKIPITASDAKPFKEDKQEDSKEVERLEATVGWLQSEVKALRVHLTLLEIQSTNTLRKLKDEGRDTELTPEQTHRVQVLTTLKKELEMELDCIKEYHNLEKIRNDEDVVDFSQPVQQRQQGQAQVQAQPKPSGLYRTRSVDRSFISDVTSMDLNPRYIPRGAMTEPHSKFTSYLPGLDLDNGSTSHFAPATDPDPRFHHPHDDFQVPSYAPANTKMYQDPMNEFKSNASDTYDAHYNDMQVPTHYIERTPKHSRITPNPGYLAEPTPSQATPFYDSHFISQSKRYSEEEFRPQYESNPNLASFDSNSSARDYYYGNVEEESQQYYEEDIPSKIHYIERIPTRRRHKESPQMSYRQYTDTPRSVYRSPPPPPPQDYHSDRYSESLRGSSIDQFDHIPPHTNSYSYHPEPKSQGYAASDYGYSNSEDSRYGDHVSKYDQYERSRSGRGSQNSARYHQYNDQSSQYTEESYIHRRKESSNYDGSEADTKSYIYRQMDQDAKSSTYSQVGNDPKWQMASEASRSIAGFDVVAHEDGSNVGSDQFEEAERKNRVENFRDRPVDLSMEMVKTISEIYKTRVDLPWSLTSSPQSSASALRKTGVSTASSGRKSRRRSISISSLSDISKLGPLGITDMLNALGGSGDYLELDPYGTTPDLKNSDVGPYSSLLSVESMPEQEEIDKRLKQYRALADQLMKVDPKSLNHEQRLAFWINIYNCIVMHAFLAYGIPQKHYKRALLMHKATYVVGGMNFSIMAIEYAILRACSYHHTILGLLPETCFKPSDERFSCALDRPEPLVTFALCNGTYSSPCLRVYSATNVHHELQIAAREYVQAAIGITKADKVLIPRLLLWYSKDFASDTIGLMHWVGKLLPRAQRETMMNLFPKWRCKALKVIQVVPYDWRFRYLFKED